MNISPVKLSLVVARARNGVIGRDGDLPWRLKDDLKHFKSLTSGAPIIMGRKTWESLPKRPLPGRTNIVLTRDWTYAADGARVYGSLGSAVAVARSIAEQSGRAEAFVIGGEAVYAAALQLADQLHITEVDAEVDGDAVFPSFDEGEWIETARTAFAASDDNDHAFIIRTLQRRR